MFVYSGSSSVASSYIVDGRKYPYFVDPIVLAQRRYGVHPLVVLKRRKELIELGVKRLHSAIKRGVVPPPAKLLEEEVFSFYVAAVTAVVSGSKWIVSRLALGEAERAARLLSSESDEALASIGLLAGMRSLRFSLGVYREPIAVVNGVPVYTAYNFSVSFVEYISVARRLLGDNSWKPVNLPVKRGLVFLDRKRMERVLKEALYSYIENLIVRLGGSVEPREVPEEVVEAAKRIGEESVKKRFQGFKGAPQAPGVIIEEAFPPCIAALVEAARRGEHLSHHERFALATFLLNIGADVDYVVDMFRSMPDFNEKITRYQVEHLAGLRGSGKKYRVYSCEKMKTLGICRAECGTRTPIQAYYRNLRSKNRRGGGRNGSRASGG